MPKKLNQQGISIFEMSIVVLILILVGISTWFIATRIREHSQKDYDNVRIWDDK